MKRNQLSVICGLAFGVMCSSCYKDLGNYDYRDINEVSIGEEAFDTTYVLRSFIDTLRIEPQVTQSMIQNPDNYEYRWVAVEFNTSKNRSWELGREKNLCYLLDLPEQDYSLYFHVKDKTTNVVTTRVAGLSLTTLFSSGWLLLGESDEGKVQLDMLSFTENDTLLLKNILGESGLPELSGPTFLFVPMDMSAMGVDAAIQVGTEKGTYKLDRNTMMPLEDAHLKYSFWDISSAGNCVLQEANQLYSFRMELIDGNLYYDRDRMSGRYMKIGNPSNRYQGSYELFELGNKIGCNLSMSGRTLTAVVGYDNDNKRFVYQGGGMSMGPEGFFKPIPSIIVDDEFWNPGKDFVTTINSRFGSMSNYTILKNADAASPADYYLYGYNMLQSFSGDRVEFKYLRPAQQMTNALEIDKAEFYAAAQRKAYIIYAVGSKVYGYDYMTGTGEVLLDFAGKDMMEEEGKKIKEEITALWNEQYLMMTMGDVIYLGLYDPGKPQSSGGRLVGYEVSTEGGGIKLVEIPGSSQKGLCKIKSIAYKE